MNKEDQQQNPKRGAKLACNIDARSSFFAQVRHLDAVNHDVPRIGNDPVFRRERVRFRQVPHLHFAPSTMESVDLITERGYVKADLTVFFLGLLGPNGPMPLIFTEVLRARARGLPHPDLRFVKASIIERTRRDNGPVDFVDIFNHRFLSLFYRAWAASRKEVDYDRPREARFRIYLGSLIGLGMPALWDRMSVPDEAALYFSGHYSAGTRNKEGLEKILADYFDVPVRIESNVGCWVEIPADSRSSLGGDDPSSALGTGFVLGGRVWDRSTHFRIVMGPMRMKMYQHFFPGSPELKALLSMVQLYIGYDLSCEVQVVLAKEDVPDPELRGTVALGRTAWLPKPDRRTDPADLHLKIL